MSDRRYDDDYYDALRTGAQRSAEQILPHVFDLVRPASVVDFGCGSGRWLTVASELGAEVLGIDGSWVTAEILGIDVGKFLHADLTMPFDAGRTFDLALCLEVAEHLPEEAAPTIVATLANHASSVLFSAAIPGQGGTEHTNEAWPEVWVSLFASHGFICRDVLRAHFWRDASIEPWYRQNILLFVKDPEGPAATSQGVPGDASTPLAIVHPSLWEARVIEHKQCEERRAAAETEVMRLGHEWQDLSDEAAALRRELHAARQEITAVYRSLSWQLTSPLRRLRKYLHATIK